MIIALSGTPGTGKSSVSAFLQKKGYETVSINEIALENDFILGLDKERGSKILDIDKLEACKTAADEEYSITENLEDQSKWRGNFPMFLVHDEECNKYGISGSPGLVINGVTASTGRDAASLLSAVCTGFKDQPAECETELSSATPGPGFGFEATGAAAASGSCG